jgi:hypothetical protein
MQSQRVSAMNHASFKYATIASQLQGERCDHGRPPDSRLGA